MLSFTAHKLKCTQRLRSRWEPSATRASATGPGKGPWGCPILNTSRWLKVSAKYPKYAGHMQLVYFLPTYHAVTNPEFASQMPIYHLLSKDNFEINGLTYMIEGFSFEQSSEALTHLRSSEEFHQYNGYVFSSTIVFDFNTQRSNILHCLIYVRWKQIYCDGGNPQC